MEAQVSAMPVHDGGAFGSGSTRGCCDDGGLFEACGLRGGRGGGGGLSGFGGFLGRHVGLGRLGAAVTGGGGGDAAADGRGGVGGCGAGGTNVCAGSADTSLVGSEMSPREGDERARCCNPTSPEQERRCGWISSILNAQMLVLQQPVLTTEFAYSWPAMYSSKE